MSSYQNEMQRCFEMQAAALEQMLGDLSGALQDFLQAFAGRRVRRAVLLGIGSSYHALCLARPFAQRTLGVPVLVQTPESLDWLSPDAADQTLLIAASQSGTSANVLSRMEQLKAAGYRVAAITQCPDSPIGRAADSVLPLNIPPEKAGPKTMGVMATALMASCALCALHDPSGAALDALAQKARSFIALLPGNAAAAKAFALHHANALRRQAAWLVVGQKALHASAGESALKLVETVRTPVACYELEEIVHGPCACFSPATALLYLGTAWEERERPRALCNLCAHAGGSVYDVLAAEQEAGFQDTRLILQAQRHPLFEALTLLLPAQAISAWIAPLRGVDLDARDENEWTAALAGHLQ